MLAWFARNLICSDSLLYFLPLDGLAKWCLAASINILTFVWKGHSAKFKVSK